MSYPHSISHALVTVREHKRLVLVQLVANVAIGGATYGWLLIPETAVWQIAASAAVALALVGAFLLLHGGSINVFAEAGEVAAAIWSAFAGTVRRLPALFVWLMILVAWRGVLYAGDERGWAIAIASWLTLHLKQPITPSGVAMWLLRLQTMLDWFAFALWLPLGREVARSGFAAFRAGWPSWRETITSRGYWLAVVLLWIGGVWLPTFLVNWVPEAGSLRMEFASMVLRFVPTIVLAFAAWLTLLALLAQPAAARKSS